jgi:hypothetical protein
MLLYKAEKFNDVLTRRPFLSKENGVIAIKVSIHPMGWEGAKHSSAPSL